MKTLGSQIAVMIAAALVGTTGCDRNSEGHGHDDHGHGHGHGHGDHHDDHEDDFEKGPHGGRLLRDGDFSLEMVVFEAGVPPQLRVYARVDHEAALLESGDVKVELRRLGDRIDRLSFRKEDGFLASEQVVYEPHSFSVMVEVTHGGKAHRWEYESPEARTRISGDAAAKSGIRVETVGQARIRSELELAGEVRFNAEMQAVVPARFGGVVVEVMKRVGDKVAKGDLLAVIESRELADARAEYMDTVHRLELAQSRFLREAELKKKKIGVEQEYLEARHELEETEIHRQTSRQKLLTLGITAEELADLAMEPDGEVVAFKVRRPFPEGSLSRFNLVSPLAGEVISRNVAAGQLVRADADLFEIADIESVWVDLTVYSAQMSRVSPGQTATVFTSEVSAEGKIAYRSPYVTEPSRAGTARVLLENRDGRWHPGQFVRAKVVTGESVAALAVRSEALQTFRDWQVVFLNEGEEYEPVVVETGLSDGKWVEIRSGLKPGQRYAATGSFVVKADILKSGATHDH